MKGVPILHVGACGTPGRLRPLPEFLQEFLKLDDSALERGYPHPTHLSPVQSLEALHITAWPHIALPRLGSAYTPLYRPSTLCATFKLHFLTLIYLP